MRIINHNKYKIFRKDSAVKKEGSSMTQNTIESILNNLSGTAIYVIRQDDHRILYFNDRVKEVTQTPELDQSAMSCGLVPAQTVRSRVLKTRIRTAPSITMTPLARWWTSLLQK